ncbi:MAG: endolytic transglycosylase MltG [Lachnospiraceae bacterium]|nr:endolytic transglycosylase MltG [Lachnospiraceae bacterium]
MDVNKVIYKFIRFAFSVMLILLIIYGTVHVSLIAYDFGYRVFIESAIDEIPGTDVVVTIESYMGAEEIGQVLEEKGLVRDKNLFFIQLKLSAYSNKILSGTYTLNTSMTPKEMMIVMSTVPEEDTEQ